MKFIFSFLFPSIFLSIQAQEKDSIFNSEIADVVVNFGKPKLDCQKIYDKEKGDYQVQSRELNNLNFETLFYEIFKLKELQDLKSNNRKILIFNPDYKTISNICGNDSYFDCRHYEKNIQDEVFEKIWRKNNFLIIENFFNNKVIIPLIRLPFWSFEQNMRDKNNYIKRFDVNPFFKGIYFNLNNVKKKFYYSSYRKGNENLKIHLQKDRMIAEDFLQLNMSILPEVSDYSTAYNVKITIIIDGIELSRLDILYQHKSGKWSVLKQN